MKRSNSTTRAVDRIAVAATFSAAILILATFGLTAESAIPATSGAAAEALSSCGALPISESDCCTPTVTFTGSRG
jgi:hypothetical protein